jgi:heat shock protein Hsp20
MIFLSLILKGEKKEEDGKSYHHIERTYGSFTRTIHLPAYVNTDEVEARDCQGVLEIVLPKVEKAKTKKIVVRTA